MFTPHLQTRVPSVAQFTCARSGETESEETDPKSQLKNMSSQLSAPSGEGRAAPPPVSAYPAGQTGTEVSWQPSLLADAAKTMGAAEEEADITTCARRDIGVCSAPKSKSQANKRPKTPARGGLAEMTGPLEPVAGPLSR